MFKVFYSLYNVHCLFYVIFETRLNSISISGFVFGANLTDRVLASSSSNDEVTEEKKDETDDTHDSGDNASSSKTEQKALKEIEVRKLSVIKIGFFVIYLSIHLFFFLFI